MYAQHEIDKRSLN